MTMETAPKNTKKGEHKPKAKKKKKFQKPASSEQDGTKIAKKQKTVAKTVDKGQPKRTQNGVQGGTKKSKMFKRSFNRHATKYIEFVRNPASNDSKIETDKSTGIMDKSKTGKLVKGDVAPQSSDAKKKGKGKYKYKKGTKPQDSQLKVQTHAALYRNPQEFSSNWKKLSQEIGTGKKETVKRKAEREESSPAAKRRKRDGQIEKKSVKVAEKPAEKKPEVWFDDVDVDLLDLEVQTPAETKPSKGKAKTKSDAQDESTTESETKEDASNKLVKERSFEGLTKAVAMDCEMVGVGSGGVDSVLARVSIVNQFGKCIYDKFVKPREQVTDYRTQFSGVRPEDLRNAEDFITVQKDVYEIMKGRMLVGHALHNDLKVLYLDHPRKKIRDTSRYRGFRKLFQGRTPSLKKLTASVLNVKVQEGEHNSVEDAQAAMRLYTMYKVQWEKEIKLKHNKKLLKPVAVTNSNP